METDRRKDSSEAEMTIQLPTHIDITGKQGLMLWAVAHCLYGITTYYHWLLQKKKYNTSNPLEAYPHVTIAHMLYYALIGFEAKLVESVAFASLYPLFLQKPWNMRWHKPTIGFLLAKQEAKLKSVTRIAFLAAVFGATMFVPAWVPFLLSIYK